MTNLENATFDRLRCLIDVLRKSLISDAKCRSGLEVYHEKSIKMQNLGIGIGGGGKDLV